MQVADSVDIFEAKLGRDFLLFFVVDLGELPRGVGTFIEWAF